MQTGSCQLSEGGTKSHAFYYSTHLLYSLLFPPPLHPFPHDLYHPFLAQESLICWNSLPIPPSPPLPTFSTLGLDSSYHSALVPSTPLSSGATTSRRRPQPTSDTTVRCPCRRFPQNPHLPDLSMGVKHVHSCICSETRSVEGKDDLSPISVCPTQTRICFQTQTISVSEAKMKDFFGTHPS